MGDSRLQHISTRDLQRELDERVRPVKEKTLTNVDMATAKEAVGDLVVVGDPGAWVVVCKAASPSEGWMKSTKVRRVYTEGVASGATEQAARDHLLIGWLYQVTTQQRNPDGSYALAEALTFVPRVRWDKAEDVIDYDRLEEAVTAGVRRAGDPELR